MRLTVDMRLTRNSCLINGRENSGRCFHCFQYIACSTWQSKQVLWRVSFVAMTFTSTSGCRLLERYQPCNGRRATTMTNLLSVSSIMLLSLAMFLKTFCRCFGISSGMEGPSLVKSVEESAVFVLCTRGSSQSCDTSVSTIWAPLRYGAPRPDSLVIWGPPRPQIASDLGLPLAV